MGGLSVPVLVVLLRYSTVHLATADMLLGLLEVTWERWGAVWRRATDSTVHLSTARLLQGCLGTLGNSVLGSCGYELWLMSQPCGTGAFQAVLVIFLGFCLTERGNHDACMVACTLPELQLRGCM